MKSMADYIESISKLHTDNSPARWTAATYHRAPHKPLLLLSVIDLFAEGVVKSNLIEISTDLGELFTLYWARVMPPDRRGNIALPFFFLKSDGFWKLYPRPGKESILASARHIRSINELRETVLGAKLDDELYKLFCAEDSRNILRAVLIETYFAPELRPGLLEQGLINAEAYKYSQELLEQARTQQPKKVKEDTAPYQAAVRDQAFRRAVVTAYSHRCAFCGIRMRTPDGHTAVEAAHIIPWSLTRNDDPRNGMALCQLCHWTFDEGLLGISQKYIVLASPQLTSNHNIPGHLPTLLGRIIIGPEEKVLWPDLGSLSWHHREKFRKR